MIGFLDETGEEIWETIQIARELPLVSANFNLETPIPGTAMFDEALREGRLQLDRINWDTCTSDQIAIFKKARMLSRRSETVHRILLCLRESES